MSSADVGPRTSAPIGCPPIPSAPGGGLSAPAVSAGPSGRSLLLALSVAIVAISCAAIFFRLAAPTDPLVMASVRLLLAGGVLVVPVVLARRAGKLPDRVLGLAAIGGLLYAVHFGAWVWSLSLTTVAASVTLVTATPIFMGLWAVVRREDVPSTRQWIAIGVALVGVLAIGGVDLGGSWAAFGGDLLAVVGAIAIGVYLIVVRRHRAEIEVWSFLGVASLVAGVALAFVCVAVGTPFQLASPAAFGWLAASALISQLIGHGVLTWALSHATPTTVAVATVGEPVGATLLAWCVLAEVPGVWVLAGCAVVLLGLGIAATERSALRSG